MFRCGARPVNTGNVTAQDDTVSLSLVGTENLPSSSQSIEDDDDPTAFDDIRQVVIHDHIDLPISFRQCAGIHHWFCGEKGGNETRL